jgi:hypothetical protein
MTFEQFANRVGALLEPYRVEEMPEHNTDERRAWKSPRNDQSAVITSDPNIHWPAMLGLGVFSEDGTWKAVGFGAPQMPLPLALNDYGVKTAAIKILQFFGIDNDLTAAEE